MSRDLEYFRRRVSLRRDENKKLIPPPQILVSLLTFVKKFVHNDLIVTKSDLKLASKDLQYLKTLVKSELEKFDDVSEVTKDPAIKEERNILKNIDRKLSL